MKSMLNKALLVASLFVVPVMVAAEGKRDAEATATSTSLWAKTKSGFGSAYESAKSAGKRSANFVADYTVRTSPAQRFGRLFLAKDGSVSKTKVGLAAATYAGIAALTYKTIANADKNSAWYTKVAKWATSPFWGPVHLVRSGSNAVWTYAHPSAEAKAEKAKAKAVKALAAVNKDDAKALAAAQQAVLKADLVVAQAKEAEALAALKAIEATHEALCKSKSSTEDQRKASDIVVAIAKKALAEAQAAVVKAQEALAPKAAALPATPVQTPAPVVAQPAAPATPVRQPEAEVKVVRSTPVKATPVVPSKEEIAEAKAEVARFHNAKDPVAYRNAHKQQGIQANRVLRAAGLVK